MKLKNLLSILLLLTFSKQGDLFAQKIPTDSPKSTLVQRIGINDVTISYGRPGVKGRKILGGIVPYGQVWRTGANYPTFIRLIDTTFFGIKKEMLPPAKYALYSIPSKDKWIIILSKDTTRWGAFGYDEKNDALRFEVTPDTLIQFTETFTIYFSDVEDSQANIVLQWEKTKVSFPVSVSIDDKVINYIKEKIQSSEKPDSRFYLQGSNYLLKHKIYPNLALEWINKLVELEPTSCPGLWIKAQILAWIGNYKEAIEEGENAIICCTSEKNAQYYFQYEMAYKSEIEKWKNKNKK